MTVRTIGGPAYPEKMDKMDRELTKVIEDFNHAVDVEALWLAKKNGMHVLTLPGDISLSMPHAGTRAEACAEQDLLLTQLKRVETSYDLTLCCMEGTWETLLN